MCKRSLMNIKMKEYFESRKEELLSDISALKEMYLINNSRRFAHDMRVAQNRLFELERAERVFMNLMNQED